MHSNIVKFYPRGSIQEQRKGKVRRGGSSPAQRQTFIAEGKKPKDCFKYQGGLEENPERAKGVGLSDRVISPKKVCSNTECLDANDHPNMKEWGGAVLVDSVGNDAMCCSVASNTQWKPFDEYDE